MSSISRSVTALVFGLAVAGTAHASSFEDALDYAYQNNPHILAERQRLEATDENIAQAVSGFRPTIGGQYEYGRQRTSFGDAPFTYGPEQLKAISVTQPLFRGGGTWASYQSARQQVKAGENTLASVEQNVLLQTITNYMDVISTSAILGLSHDNEALIGEQLDSTNIRFKVGEVTRTDVAESESRLADAKSSTITAQGALDNALTNFERIAGYRPEGTLTVPTKLPELPASLAEALERGRSVNPQLMAALHTVKASQYNVRSSEAVLLPTVNLVGSMSRQQGAGASGLDNLDQDKVAVEVNIPLYQGGAEYARIRQAEATSRQRDHEAIDTRMSIDQAIGQAWQQYETATANIGMRQEQIKAAQVAVDGVRQEQQYGARTIRDVLDTEEELYGARTDLVRAQRDRIVAAYNLAYTLGELTPANLNLSVAQYDATEHAEDMKWKAIGF